MTMSVKPWEDNPINTKIAYLKHVSEKAQVIIRFRPNSGSIWIDALFTLMICYLQLYLLPLAFHSWMVVDLLTPWLIVGFVTQPLISSILLTTIAALTLETHMTAPLGIYFCIYWVVLVAISFTKDNLTWRYTFPWIMTFLLSGLWVAGFEFFVRAVTGGVSAINLSEALVQIARVLIIPFIGLWFAKRWLAEFSEEELNS